MKLLNTMLARFVKTGTLIIIDADGNRHEHGSGEAPVSTVRLKDKTLYRKLFLNPELCAGEAYMDGTLVVEDGSIRDLLKIFALNRTGLRSHPFQKIL
jgi:cyclopropane-fatty-acyl-phospholipid synthase